MHSGKTMTDQKRLALVGRTKNQGLLRVLGSSNLPNVFLRGPLASLTAQVCSVSSGMGRRGGAPCPFSSHCAMVNAHRELEAAGQKERCSGENIGRFIEMVSKRRLSVVVAVLGLMLIDMFGAFGKSCDAEEPKGSDWRVTVSPRKTANGGWNLQMSIEYLGTKTVEVSYAELPWSWSYAMQVTAIEATLTGAQLPESFPVDDPPSGIVRVEPGQVLNGSVPLSARIPSLADDAKLRPIVVFWTFKFRGFRRMGGWVEIPPQGPGTAKDTQ